MTKRKSRLTREFLPRLELFVECAFALAAIALLLWPTPQHPQSAPLEGQTVQIRIVP